jgi:DNA-directed RNA polymerase delta subunit
MVQRHHRHANDSAIGPLVINTILDAIEFILENQGEPQSPYWLASQMMEMRLWRASEYDVRAALERDIRELGERSRFVQIGDGEWGLTEWGEQ